ncbi:unnamed protein product, partial [Effrenium voratum]
EARSNAVDSDAVTLSAGLGSCRKASRWNHALQLMDTLRPTLQADVVVWNFAISACNDGKQGLKAVKLLEDLRCEGLQPTVVTYGTLVPCVREWLWALRLLKDAGQRSVRLSSPFRNSLLHAMSQAEQWREAAAMLSLKESSWPNTISFNTLMTGTRWAKAQQLLRTMRSWRLDRSVSSFGAALSEEGWQSSLHLTEEMRQEGFSLNLRIFSSLVDVLDPWDQALSLLGAAQEHQLEPNMLTLGAGLKSLADWEKSQDLLQRGRGWSFEPDYVCWEDSSMLRQFFSKQNLVQEVDASGSMEQVSSQKGSRQARAANAMSAVYQWGEKWELALGALWRSADAVGYNTALAACRKDGWPASALLLEMMRDLRLKLDGVGSNAACSSLSVGGCWEQCIDLVVRMRTSRIDLESATSSAATSSCKQAGKWQEALCVVRWLELAGTQILDPEVRAVAVRATEGRSSMALQDPEAKGLNSEAADQSCTS